MDLRVLTAVFVTLLAIAIGMSHGGLTSEDVLGAITDFTTTRGDISDVLQERADTQANHTISVQFTADEPVDLDIGIPVQVALAANPGTRITVGDSTLTPSTDAPIRFDGFTGSTTITPGNLSIDGTADTVTAGGFTFNYSAPAAVTIDQGRITQASFSGLQGQTITAQNVTGSATVIGTDVSLRGERVLVEAFTGNLSIAESTYDLNGRFYRAVLGAGTFGATK